MLKEENLVDLFQQLYDLTIEQSKSIQAEDYERLQDLLEKKQAVMDRIDEVGYSPQDAEQVKDLLLQIQTIDRANEKEVLAKYIATCMQLTDLGGSHQVSSQSARFLDKRA
ncbi:MAG TPA: hypothetical protein GXX57_11065 [Firmicutes bacterium]|nr:hypothetical protein [Bacillota bacterium]